MARGSPVATAAGARRRSDGAPRVTVAAVADVATAQGVLLVALLRARFRPTGALVEPMRGDAGSMGADRGAAEARPATVERALRAIDRASRRGLFRPTCLVRSLALARLLERWGVHGARIRIGVRRAAPPGAGMVTGERADGGMLTSGGDPRPVPHGAAPTGTTATRPVPGGAPPHARLLAHAWVELDGRVIGDDPRHVARFSPLGSVASVPFRWR